jgi:hypothetical protein
MTWQAIAPRGRLVLVNGRRAHLVGFGQELAHWSLHRVPDDSRQPGHVLWCDGDHGFNPYDFAELNLERGHEAAAGAERLLVKRCMTAFQWDTVLTQHLEDKLRHTATDLVIVSPFERLFVHEELRDWEQEDYVRFAASYLRGLAKRMDVPILLCVDMARWWQTHPVLAQATYEAVHERWSIDAPDGRWRARDDVTGQVVDPWLRRQVTLVDYEDVAVPVLVRPWRPVA